MVHIFTFKNQPNAPDSLLPVLYVAGMANKYQNNSSTLTRSLRVTVLLCLLTELDGAEEALKEIQGAKWMTAERQWMYQVWSHAEAS